MSLQAVLLPVVVLVALTFVLLGLMGRRRFLAVKGREVRVSDIALGQSAWPEAPARCGRAYQNQFELPVLFYVLVAFALMARKSDLAFVILEWVFVASRLAHAFIHVTTNHVPHRFAAFVFGMVVLLLMWLVFAIRVLASV
jgi:hypothetical protein